MNQKRKKRKKSNDRKGDIKPAAPYTQALCTEMRSRESKVVPGPVRSFFTFRLCHRDNQAHSARDRQAIVSSWLQQRERRLELIAVRKIVIVVVSGGCRAGGLGGIGSNGLGLSRGSRRNLDSLGGAKDLL